MRLTLCAVALAAAFAVAGCGDDSSRSSGDDSAQAAATSTAPRRTQVVYHNPLPKPRPPGAHAGARVDQLIIRDLRIGTGPALAPGDTGMFDFIGSNWITGERLEDSWHRPRPFETQIERGVVIDGWFQGIPGMRVGGRRQIVVPPSLGFLGSPVPGLSGATTYFDVVLLSVRPQLPPGLGGREPTPAPTVG